MNWRMGQNDYVNPTKWPVVNIIVPVVIVSIMYHSCSTWFELHFEKKKATTQ